MKVLTALTAALVLATVGCGSTTGTGSDPDGPGVDGDWFVSAATVGGRGLVLLPRRPLTLRLAGTTASGSSGCNQFSGTVTQADGGLRFSALAGTEMACEEPAMTLESQYLAGLDAVRTATVTNETLTLGGEGVSMTLEPVAPEPTLPLGGTVWTLESLISGDAVSSTIDEPATLVFLDDGTLSGTTGCRAFRGGWSAAGDTISVGELATTKTSCSAVSSDQDDHVLTVLKGRLEVRRAGSGLTLTAADGRGLDYRG